MSKYLINILNIILTTISLGMYFYVSSFNLNLIISILFILIYYFLYFLIRHTDFTKTSKKVLLCIILIIVTYTLISIIIGNIHGNINMVNGYLNIAGLIYTGSVIPYLLIRILIESINNLKNKVFDFSAILKLISLIVVTISLIRVLSIVPIYLKFDIYVYSLLEQNALMYALILYSSLVSSYSKIFRK